MNKKILALDQASKISGFCVMKNKKYYESGLLYANDKDDTIARLENMFNQIVKLINRVKPDYVVFEGIQFQKNYQTYKTLAQLQGLIMAYLFLNDYGFTIIESTAWKSCCGIKGRNRDEQKKNTQKYVENTYDLQVSEDEADAIGIASWANKNIKEIIK